MYWKTVIQNLLFDVLNHFKMRTIFVSKNYEQTQKAFLHFCMFFWILIVSTKDIEFRRIHCIKKDIKIVDFIILKKKYEILGEQHNSMQF